MMKTRLIVALTYVACASVSNADNYVQNADANGDGFVSLHELRAAYFADPEFNRRIEASFARFDRNGDGLISDAERQLVSGNIGEGPTEPPPLSVGADQGRDDATDVRRQPAPRVETAPVAVPAVVADDDPGAAPPAARRGTGTTGMPEPIGSRRGGVGNAGSGGRATWLAQIDTDGSGGASIAELVASGDGQPWFTKKQFNAADRNDDGDLDATELEALMRGIETRRR